MQKEIRFMTEETKEQLVQIENGIHFAAASGSILETTKYQIEPDTNPIMMASLSSKPWAIWGQTNDYPQRIIDENSEETASAGALRFKRFAHYGKGLMFYREDLDANNQILIKPLLKKDIPKEIKKFWFDNDIENFQQGIIGDFEWWNFLHAQYIPNLERNKIVGINWVRTRDIRPKKRSTSTGKIDSYYLSHNWPLPKDGEFVDIPAFDKRDPFKHPNAIYRHALVSIDKDYFPTPEWHSNIAWLNLAKRIPVWILANIENAVNLKYHIKIPQSYFEKLYPRDRFDSDEAWMKAMNDAEVLIKKKIDELLSGEKNVSKIFYSKIAIDENGTPLPGWEIIELKNDIKDGAWLQGYGTAAAAICTAHGVPPSLAGLILANGLGTGSASDVREQFNYYMQLHTVIPRQTTLEWFEFVKMFNKWPEDIHLGYREVILQSLDQNKSGFSVQNEQSPTSAKP